MSEHRAVVVLGMHRSGTSAITRGLAYLGVELGGDLLEAVAKNNERGFWEDRAIVDLNDRLLGALGSRWDGVWLGAALNWESEQIGTLKLEAVDLVRSRFGHVPLWGFKDPRSVRLLPFWQSVLARSGIADSYVIAVRNPLNVARSLLERDRMSPAKAYVLWLSHVLPAIDGTALKPRVVVDYDRVLTDPAGQLKRIAKALKLASEDDASSRAQAFAQEFLSEDLRHHRLRIDDMALDNNMSRLVQGAFVWLDRLAQDAARFDDPALLSDWRDIGQLFRDQGPLLRYLDSRDAEVLRLQIADQRLESVDHELARVREALAMRERRIEELAAEFAQLSRRLADAVDESNRQHVALLSVYNSKSWWLTAPLRAVARAVRAVRGALTRNAIAASLLRPFRGERDGG